MKPHCATDCVYQQIFDVNGLKKGPSGHFYIALIAADRLQVIMGQKQKELRNVTGQTCLVFRHDYRILELRMICTLQRYKISFNVQKLSLFWCPLTSFALVTALGKLSFLKQKLSQSKLIQLQIAMSIFYDLIMQCLHCLCNVHGRITLLICRAVVSYRPSQLTAK